MALWRVLNWVVMLPLETMTPHVPLTPLHHHCTIHDNFHTLNISTQGICNSTFTVTVFSMRQFVPLPLIY